MTNFPNSLRLTALAATLTFFAGCGSMPSAPVLDDSSARVANNGVQAQQAYTLPSDDQTLPDGGSAPMIDPAPEDELPLGGGGTQNQGTMLTEALGGTVRNGRWRVEVPPGAVVGSARVSVTPNSSRAGIVSLGIFPSEKNYFATPVRLVVDCRTVPTSKLRGWFISWYNPATGIWTRVPGSTVDSRRKIVSAPLSHFSLYCVGANPGRSGF
jgi:hypothetical protein